VHIRQQVRKGIKARLETALAGSGVTVWQGRTVKFRSSELPAVNVFSTEDAVVGESPDHRREDRQIDIAVSVLIVGTREDALDAADDIAELIEPAMRLARDWQIPLTKLDYSSADVAQVVGADGEIIALTLRYYAGVAIAPGNPSTTIVNAQPLR
jgi:hypothetical protein